MLVTIAIVCVITGVMIVSIGLFFIHNNSDLVKIEKGTKTIVRKEYEIKDFDVIDLTGFWKTKIESDKAYRVTVVGPEYVIKYIRIASVDRTLKVNQAFFTGIPPKEIAITISMPGLKRITCSGGADIDFSGFDESSLSIETTGYSKRIRGSDSRITDLSVTGTGVLDFDFDDCAISNATLDLTGRGNIALNMSGGVLDGRVRGGITVTCGGIIGEHSIEFFEGAGFIRKEEK